jgi:hypothetical protein
MNRIIIALLLLAFAPTFALGQGTTGQASQPDAKLGQELIALRKAWVEARKRRDAETMSRLMADEWTITTPEGNIVTREQSLARAKAGTSTILPDPAYDNVTARAYGDTAVLTFRAKNETGYTRQLEVYVKRQGHWQWVAGQSTKLAEQQPQ